MNQIKNVLIFEYMNIIKNKSFLITNLIFAVVIFAVAFFPNLATLFGQVTAGFGQDEKSAEAQLPQAAYVDESGLYDARVLSDYFPHYEWVAYQPSQIDEIIESIKNKDTQIGIYFKDQFSYDLFSESSVGGANLRPYNEMIIHLYQKSELTQQNISQEKIDEVLHPQVLPKYVPVDSGSFWFGYAALMIVFFPLVMYGSMISLSVVNEKTSRTVELLFTSTTPKVIIFGKVFGVGLVLVTQIAFLLISSVLALALSGSALFTMISASTVALLTDVSMLIYILTFAFCAFLCYSFIYAACASTVRDAQEAQAANTIPSLLSVAGFYIGMMACIGNIGEAFVTVTSFVPFLSPCIMIARISTSYVPLYQILLAIGINLLTVVFAGVISSRIYSACIMAYGKKLSTKGLIQQIIKR